MQIILPMDYQNIMADGSYTCYISDWIDNQAIPPITCSLLGLTITVNGAFSSISGTLTVNPYTFYGVVVN
jgi:hypothetical protein